jgi:predicted  nucleic acid-binding Zn-ribbon protein
MTTPESTRPGAPEASLESALLDRLERQVAELTELKTRVKSLEGALEAERKTRSEMSDRLTAERERVRKLEEELQSLGTDEHEVATLRDHLARERQSAVALGSQLEQAWTQLNDLKAGQRETKGPFRRKHR